MQGVFPSSTTTSFPRSSQPTDCSCESRTEKIALAVLFSLVGFLFFPVGVAFGITAGVTIVAEVWTRIPSRIPSPIPKTQSPKKTPQKNTPQKLKYSEILSPVTPKKKKPVNQVVSPMKEEMDRVVRSIMSRLVENPMSPISVEIIDTLHPNDLPDTIILKFNSEEAVSEFIRVRGNALSVLATIQKNEGDSHSLTLCLRSHIIKQGVTVNEITSIIHKIFGDDIPQTKTPFKSKHAKISSPASVSSPIVQPNATNLIKHIVCKKKLVTINFRQKSDQIAFFNKYRFSAPGDMNFSLATSPGGTCVHIAAAHEGINGQTITKWLEQEFGNDAINNVRARKNFIFS